MSDITFQLSDLFSEKHQISKSFETLNDGQVVDVNISHSGRYHVKVCNLIFEVNDIPKSIGIEKITQSVIKHVDSLNLGWIFSKALSQLHKIEGSVIEKFHLPEDKFLSMFNEQSGFNLYCREDYSYVMINKQLNKIATYNEGDVEVTSCKTDRTFNLTLSHTTSFYNYY